MDIKWGKRTNWVLNAGCIVGVINTTYSFVQHKKKSIFGKTKV
jgi:hypothetical protein